MVPTIVRHRHWVLKNSLDKNDLGIVLEKQRCSRYQKQQLSDLDFPDEIALIDESEQRLQHATSKVEEKGRKVGLTINSKKTKVIDVTEERNDIATILSNLNSLENVDKFVCLGSTISHNGNLTSELDIHIGKAANAVNRLLPVMRHKSIKMPTKTAIYQAVVLSTLLYGSESWNTTVQEEKRLPSFHTRCLRRILCVPWQEPLPNEVISSRESAKHRSSTSYDTNALHGLDMSPVCTRLTCPAACSPESHEGAVARADNACAGKIQRQ